MALIIRLRQQGSRNAQTYRVVVMEKTAPRDGKYIEKLGWFNPLAKEGQEYDVDQERISHWISQGAQISESARTLVRRAAPSLLQGFEQSRMKRKIEKKKRIKAKRESANK